MTLLPNLELLEEQEIARGYWLPLALFGDGGQIILAIYGKGKGRTLYSADAGRTWIEKQAFGRPSTWRGNSDAGNRNAELVGLIAQMARGRQHQRMEEVHP